MNAMASVIRGTRNMLVHLLLSASASSCSVPLSPCLIFGFGPVPALGIAGAGVAVVLTTALTVLVLAWYIGSGRSLVRFKLAPHASGLVNILRAAQSARSVHCRRV